ncbi:MAG: hypothetical protein QF886_16360 [Planctomycetota bacterium]|nr:hypothetical protein [Planctomycetota bacterium]
MQYDEIQYLPEEDDPSLTLESEELVIKVIDNTGLLAPPVDSASYFNASHRVTPFVHHLGYHGIRTLYSREEKRNLVVPFASWLNLQGATLEGIDSDLVDERAWAGHGRGWPMRLDQQGEKAVITLDPLPSMQMTYRLELQAADPDAVDFSIRFNFGRRPESGPVKFRASWPCYMNAWDDVRLFYPRGESEENWEWASIGEKPDLILGETVSYQHQQQGFFAEDQAIPLAYGRLGERALSLMFSDPSVRFFTVNAGGHMFFSPVQNPAWDFEWIIEDYPTDEEVGFEGRIIYSRFESEDAILQRYLKWKNQQD